MNFVKDIALVEFVYIAVNIYKYLSLRMRLGMFSLFSAYVTCAHVLP
jgi:hypothetical protein